LRFHVLGCSGSQTPAGGTCSFLIGDDILLEMGSAAASLPLERQVAVRSVLLSHAHLDHIKDLPFLVENVYRPGSRPLDVYATSATLDALRQHIFNDSVWPDFTVLPTPEEGVLDYHEVRHGEKAQIGALQVTAIPVNHPGGCAGFLLDSGDGVLVYSGDTGPTRQLWEAVNQLARPLRAILVETSFPDRLQSLAAASGHLTPGRLREELDKIDDKDVAVYVYHLKEPTRQETVAELLALGDARIQLLEPGMDITF
jgi:ribonuclease BN (tRNA processing enzyme)